MPRYFFHILHPDSSSPILDDEGAEFEDYEAAKHEAVESARDLAIDAIKRGNKVDGFAVEIMDEAGKVLDTIRAREAIN
jgi:hypothetical protein